MPETGCRKVQVGGIMKTLVAYMTKNGQYQEGRPKRSSRRSTPSKTIEAIDEVSTASKGCDLAFLGFPDPSDGPGQEDGEAAREALRRRPGRRPVRHPRQPGRRPGPAALAREVQAGGRAAPTSSASSTAKESWPSRPSG
ncbi:MAG: hypothetical protein MZV64_14410 [Ignavibacteriales bacterium]|nr:hypothetical protein [Ignavibacteriales bacterium]